MSYHNSIVKIQQALPFKKYLEILFYRNASAKFSMNLEFIPYGTASHRGLFFTLDVIGFTFFFSLFSGLLPYWMISRTQSPRCKIPASYFLREQKKVTQSVAIVRCKGPCCNPLPPIQSQLDKENSI